LTSQTQSPAEKDQEAESIRLMLDVIETRDRVTQRGLSGELGIALGLTNLYLKRCINKGLIKVRKAPARRYAYYLTARGFAEKARLTAKYLARSLSYFRVAREDCSELLAACQARGLTRVVLVGAGDLCEIATLAALDSGIQVVAVLDPATNRQQVAGVRVIRDLAALDGAGPGSGAPEAVVITDMKDPQATYERMVALLGQDRVLFPSLLRLSPPRMAGLAAAQ
jgi:DNA-binding MarR family transcriptional regulator